ncbi:MAG: thioredoxin-disulfide reductase [Anaerolineaceae bacterium]|nr:thioredoxin-disulfide reductase [Anaerolineaceae bacterium]
MAETNHHQLVIIGSGPAGLSAGLYAARAELNPQVFTGLVLHGQASLTNDIENYPGFPDGIGGEALGALFQQQAEKFGAVIIYDSIKSVNLQKKPYILDTYSNSYSADTVIIATGADPKKLNIPGELELTGRGVSYCATCDGWFFKEKEVVVVGGGDSALEEALFLTRFAKTVTIIHRRDSLRAGALLESRAKKNPKIKFVWDSVVREIMGDGAVSSVKIQNVQTNSESSLKCDGIFIFIGHKPNSDLFIDQLEMDEQGYIKVDKKMKTNVPGVFAAGEIADPHYRQVITSAGMGAAAAIEATHYIESLTL